LSEHEKRKSGKRIIRKNNLYTLSFPRRPKSSVNPENSGSPPSRG